MQINRPVLGFQLRCDILHWPPKKARPRRLVRILPPDELPPRGGFILPQNLVLAGSRFRRRAGVPVSHTRFYGRMKPPLGGISSGSVVGWRVVALRLATVHWAHARLAWLWALVRSTPHIYATAAWRVNAWQSARSCGLVRVY